MAFRVLQRINFLVEIDEKIYASEIVIKRSVLVYDKIVLYFSKGQVQIPVATLVSLSKTLNYYCFSPPRGKWVPVRAEMVLVVDLAE